MLITKTIVTELNNVFYKLINKKELVSLKKCQKKFPKLRYKKIKQN